MDEHDQLYEAIDSGNWDELRRLILAGAEEDFAGMDYDDDPLIFDVIRKKREDMAIFWLDNGYRQHATGGKRHLSILHMAAILDMPDLIRKVISLDGDGEELGYRDGDSHSALWHASANGSLASMRALLDAGADPDGMDAEDREDRDPDRFFPTPLCAAKDAEAAALLLDGGADVTLGCYVGEFVKCPDHSWYGIDDDDPMTPLSCAAVRGRMDIVREFLDRGIPLGTQPLRLMAMGQRGSKPEAMRELIRLGADPNGREGEEPILVAARAGKADLCRILLDAGAKALPQALNNAILSGDAGTIDLFMDAGDPEEAIKMAAERGVLQVLDRLLPRHPELAGAALHSALGGCRHDLARRLLDQGADPNARGPNGRTPIMSVYALDRRRDLYRFMLVDPDRYRPEWNCSPWERRGRMPTLEDFDMYDSMKFSYLNRPRNWNEMLDMSDEDAWELCEELIRRGADVDLKDRHGLSVLWYACAGSWEKSIPRLAALGLSFEDRSDSGRSCFEAGVMSGESLTVRPMLEAGADIDARDGNGDTPLIKAYRACRENGRRWIGPAVAVLLDCGADPDIRNNEGVSFRDLARDDDWFGHVLERREWEWK